MKRRRLLCEQRGSISILAALSLLFVIFSAALAVDVGRQQAGLIRMQPFVGRVVGRRDRGRLGRLRDRRARAFFGRVVEALIHAVDEAVGEDPVQQDQEDHRHDGELDGGDAVLPLQVISDARQHR